MDLLLKTAGLFEKKTYAPKTEVYVNKRPLPWSKPGSPRPIFLALCLTFIVLTACRQDPVERVPSGSVATQQPEGTRPEVSTRAPKPSSTATNSITKPMTAPTATQMPIPTANLTPAPPQPPAKDDTNLLIERFEIEMVEDQDSGKVVTLSWSSNGASARLFSSVQQSVQPWWEVPPSGRLTIELTTTYYPDPPFILVVYDTVDPGQASEAIQAAIPFPWPCSHAFFFEPAPPSCPSDEPILSAAAEQPFENGVMIWLEAVDSVYVLYDDQNWQRFDDTWAEGQLESDPAITPPDQRFQPIRGFGKVWREHLDVRERLGWALGPELAFESLLQEQMVEPGSARAIFLRTFNDQVVALTFRDEDAGDWVIAAS